MTRPRRRWHPTSLPAAGSSFHDPARPELLVTAKTQRRHRELLRPDRRRITAREASNARTRMKTAAFR